MSSETWLTDQAVDASIALIPPLVEISKEATRSTMASPAKEALTPAPVAEGVPRAAVPSGWVKGRRMSSSASSTCRVVANSG